MLGVRFQRTRTNLVRKKLKPSQVGQNSGKRAEPLKIMPIYLREMPSAGTVVWVFLENGRGVFPPGWVPAVTSSMDMNLSSERGRGGSTILAGARTKSQGVKFFDKDRSSGFVNSSLMKDFATEIHLVAKVECTEVLDACRQAIDYIQAQHHHYHSQFRTRKPSDLPVPLTAAEGVLKKDSWVVGLEVLVRRNRELIESFSAKNFTMEQKTQFAAELQGLLCSDMDNCFCKRPKQNKISQMDKSQIFKEGSVVWVSVNNTNPGPFFGCIDKWIPALVVSREEGNVQTARPPANRRVMFFTERNSEGTLLVINANIDDLRYYTTTMNFIADVQTQKVLDACLQAQEYILAEYKHFKEIAEQTIFSSPLNAVEACVKRDELVNRKQKMREFLRKWIPKELTTANARDLQEEEAEIRALEAMASKADAESGKPMPNDKEVTTGFQDVQEMIKEKSLLENKMKPTEADENGQVQLTTLPPSDIDLVREEMQRLRDLLQHTRDGWQLSRDELQRTRDELFFTLKRQHKLELNLRESGDVTKDENVVKENKGKAGESGGEGGNVPKCEDEILDGGSASEVIESLKVTGEQPSAKRAKYNTEQEVPEK